MKAHSVHVRSSQIWGCQQGYISWDEAGLPQGSPYWKTCSSDDGICHQHPSGGREPISKLSSRCVLTAKGNQGASMELM